MDNNSFEISNDILKQVNIVEIISHYMKLEKRGRNFTALCPFHDDKKLGNFYVNEDKQIFKCFSCNASGNAINFVARKENISYYNAMIRVCEIAGIKEPRLIDKTKKTTNPELENAYSCLKLELEFYKASLLRSNEGKDAKDYLIERGLDDDVIKYFNLGYAQSDGTMLINYLKNKNISVKTIEKTGICHLEDNPIKDINAGRIIFPIFNRQNQVVGYSARVFKGNSDAKYVNTRETIAFNKSSILYNFNNALNEAKRVGYIYVLEGFMDVIACYRTGIKAAVGLMGTALTKQHIQLLRFSGVEIRVCLDLDMPGQDATLEIIKLLDNERLNYRVVSNITNKKGKDADEILKNSGKGGLNEYLNNLITKGEWLINYFLKKYNISSLDGRKNIINSMIPFLAKIHDPLEIEDYIYRLSRLTNFSIDNIKTILKKFKNSKSQADQENSLKWYNDNKLNKTIINKLQLAEQQLMQYILENQKALKIYDQKLGFMAKESYRQIIAIIEEYLFDNKTDNYSINDLITFISLEDDVLYDKQAIINEITDLSIDSKTKIPPYTDELIDELISTINIEREVERQKQAYEEGIQGKDFNEKLLLTKNLLDKKMQKIERDDLESK